MPVGAGDPQLCVWQPLEDQGTRLQPGYTGNVDRRLRDIQSGTNEGGGEVEVDAVPESLVPLQGEDQRCSS